MLPGITFINCFSAISKPKESTSVASYLDLLFTRDRSNNITTKLYDKRDAFGFHIVNFPFMSSNIPSAPAYGVFASQLVRYTRKMSAKCLLILSVKIIFYFDGFANGQINRIS